MRSFIKWNQVDLTKWLTAKGHAGTASGLLEDPPPGNDSPLEDPPPGCASLLESPPGGASLLEGPPPGGASLLEDPPPGGASLLKGPPGVSSLLEDSSGGAGLLEGPPGSDNLHKGPSTWLLKTPTTRIYVLLVLQITAYFAGILVCCILVYVQPPCVLLWKLQGLEFKSGFSTGRSSSPIKTWLWNSAIFCFILLL